MMWSYAPWWHWLGMASFWLVIGLLATWAATQLFPSSRGPESGTTAPGPVESSATEILDVRLARGDLDVAEYRRLRDELLSGHGQDRHT